MKKRSTSYTFDASAKTIVCADFTSLEAIQIITNVTDNVIIYNFADPTKGGTLASTTLTLAFDTTSMSDTDKLMILIDDGATTVTVTGPLTDTQLRASAVPVSLSSVPSHAVTNAGTFAVQATGTVTANAGTNLNTSALAVESGGNLAAIKAKTDNIPAQGQAVAAASLPVVLPAAQITTLTPPAAITGFATSAKQDTLLAELQAKADLTETQPVSLASVPTHAVTQSGTWTVQPGNTANTVAWKVDGSAVTQPVSGTVGVTGVSTAAKQDTIISHVDGIETLLTTIESNQQSDALTDTQLRATPVPVSGTVTANLGTLNGAATAAKQDDIITAIGAIPGGGGVQYTDGDADATPTGTVAMFDDAGVMTAVSTAKPMPVSATIDTTGLALAANQQTDALTDTQLRATAVDVAVSSMPTTNVAQSGSWTVVADAGTDLNTSALALEAGNLAAIKTNTDNIPALGQALEAASVPVVLPAAQLTTLTPPAAITGFATSAKQDTIIGHVDGLETSAATIAGAVSGTEMQVDVLTMPTVTADTELPAAAALADNIANPTAPAVGAFGMVWNSNSSHWERQIAIRSGLNVGGGGIAAAGNMAQFDDTTPGTITENQFGVLRMSTNRNLYNTIRDAAGNERGVNVTAGNALTVDGSAVTQPVSGTFWQATQPVSLATNQPVGTIAHDSADSGNPIKIGGRAINAEITAVANNDRSDFITDLVGKQIVLPYANPENFVSGAITTAMTGTTSTSLVAAPASGLRNYITTIIVSNAHASVGTDVVIQDGNAGTTLMTIPAAAVYGGAVINLPVPLRQPTTATAIYCANVTTGASTKVSAVGYKGV